MLIRNTHNVNSVLTAGNFFEMANILIGSHGGTGRDVSMNVTLLQPFVVVSYII